MSKIIYINSACNQKCVFCLGRDREYDVFTGERFPVLNKFESLVISGGETTLNPYIFKILKLAKEKNARNISLQTNAVTLEDLSFCRKLFNCGIKEFNVNMPAHLDDLNDKITLTPGSLKSRLVGLNNLIRLGARIRLTFVIHKLNYAVMPDYCRFVKHNFRQVRLLVFNFVQIEGAVRDNLAIVPRLSEIKSQLLESLDYAKKVRLNLVTDNLPLCILGERKYFCFSVDYRMAIRQKKNMGLDPTLNLEKSFVPACNRCIHKDKCGGIRRDYLKLYGEGEFHPFLALK